MARKSVAVEKRIQIVKAFCDCMVELGLDAATMGEVASRVGIDRSTMHYYYKTRESLVADVAKHIAQSYIDRMMAAIERLNPEDRARSLVEFLFGPTFHDERQSILLDELGTLGNRQPFFFEQLRSVYLAVDTVIMGVFKESYPHMPERERTDLVYALLAMVEGSTVQMSLGFGKSRRLAARKLALKLLDENFTSKSHK